MIGSGGGTASIAPTAFSGLGAGTACGRKLRTWFSSDDNRAARSSTPRFAVFALASATNGRTKIAIKRPMSNRIKSSICLWGLAAQFGFEVEDSCFAHSMLIDKNGGFHRRFRS